MTFLRRQRRPGDVLGLFLMVLLVTLLLIAVTKAHGQCYDANGYYRTTTYSGPVYAYDSRGCAYDTGASYVAMPAPRFNSGPAFRCNPQPYVNVRFDTGRDWGYHGGGLSVGYDGRHWSVSVGGYVYGR